MSTDPVRLREYLTVATEAARVGAAELERWRGKFSVREKGRADREKDRADQERQARLPLEEELARLRGQFGGTH